MSFLFARVLLDDKGYSRNIIAASKDNIKLPGVFFVSHSMRLGCPEDNLMICGDIVIHAELITGVNPVCMINYIIAWRTGYNKIIGSVYTMVKK
jgi:hypothetical protein